jgi:hypothetical protein
MAGHDHPGKVRSVELAGAKLFFPVECPAESNRELRSLWAEGEATARLG